MLSAHDERQTTAELEATAAAELEAAAEERLSRLIACAYDEGQTGVLWGQSDFILDPME
jgi:hypothetical protein